MKNIKMTLSYDGTPYLGWQESIEGKTVEGELKTSLEKILQHGVVLQAASRTDAGVHAEEQIANFFTEKIDLSLKRLHFSLNQMLPPSIRIKNIEEAPLKFHPTLDAIGKEYHYRLTLSKVQLPFTRQFSWHLYFPLDLEKMREASHHFLGKHDFSAFCNVSPTPSSNPMCTLHSIEIIEEENDLLEIQIHGNRFLYKMVRTLVGTLVKVGKGELSPSQIPPLIQARDRTLAGMTAPPHGLFLKKVHY